MRYPSTNMPDISWGVCKMRKHRPAVITDLANGYCMACWDNGFPRYNKKKEEAESNE